jgi:hypothetical protein
MMNPIFICGDTPKIGAVQNWLKTQQNNCFLTELKKTCEALEPVR